MHLNTVGNTITPYWLFKCRVKVYYDRTRYRRTYSFRRSAPAIVNNRDLNMFHKTYAAHRDAPTLWSSTYSISLQYPGIIENDVEITLVADVIGICEHVRISVGYPSESSWPTFTTLCVLAPDGSKPYTQTWTPHVTVSEYESVYVFAEMLNGDPNSIPVEPFGYPDGKTVLASYILSVIVHMPTTGTSLWGSAIWGTDAWAAS